MKHMGKKREKIGDFLSQGTDHHHMPDDQAKERKGRKDCLAYGFWPNLGLAGKVRSDLGGVFRTLVFPPKIYNSLVLLRLKASVDKKFLC